MATKRRGPGIRGKMSGEMVNPPPRGRMSLLRVGKWAVSRAPATRTAFVELSTGMDRGAAPLKETVCSSTKGVVSRVLEFEGHLQLVSIAFASHTRSRQENRAPDLAALSQ